MYVGSNDGNIYALNSTTGSKIWEYYMGSQVESSPTIDGNYYNLYVGSDNGQFSCLDTRTGENKWSIQTGAAIISTAAISGNRTVFGCNNGNVYILNKYSSDIDWTFDPGYYLFNTPFSSSPVAYGNMTYIGGNDGYLYALNIDKQTSATSIFLYYEAAIAVLVIVALITIRRIRNQRK